MSPKKLSIYLSALTATVLMTKPVQALELTIENNGGGSDNQVQVAQTTNTQVAQTNDASVNNQVNVDQNTGNNQANGNSGETAITTGDISTQVEVTNKLNTTVVEAGCCESLLPENQVAIIGNGNGSTNSVGALINNQTVVNVNQTATIVNIVNGSAITGQNVVTGNQGNVEINTGNITGFVTLTNGVNSSDITVNRQLSGGLLIKVVGNGDDSINSVTYTNNQNILIQKWEEAFILNKVGFDLNTGDNRSDNNLGSVNINTGDIVFNTVIKNDPINDNKVVIDCCDDDDPDEDDDDDDDNPPPVTPPPAINPPSTVNPSPTEDKDNDDNGNDDDGIGGGDVLGEMLPATGTMDMALMLIANILLFLLGYYLRLRSGRAPARV